MHETLFLEKFFRFNEGDIQALVKLVTLGGHTVTTVITNESLNAWS